MDAAAITAVGASISAVLAATATLVTSIRTGGRITEVKALVNGTASELRAELRDVTHELVATAREVPPP